MKRRERIKLFARLTVLKKGRQILACLVLAAVISVLRLQLKAPLDDKTLFDLLKSFLEINGVLLGFVIAFYLFSSQSTEGNKQLWFFEYRKSVDGLFDLYIKLSQEKNPIADDLFPVIEAFDNTSIDNIPTHERDRVIMVEAAKKIQNIRKKNARLVTKQVLSLMLRIENSLNVLGVTTVGTVIVGTFLDSIKKLALQIVFIFFVLVFWKFMDANADVYIIFFLFLFFGLLTCGSFAELVIHLSDHYRETLYGFVENRSETKT